MKGIPKHVEAAMAEGKEGLYGQLIAAVREIAKSEPLLTCVGDTIYAEYSDDPDAKNNKKAVDEAIERVATALEAEHFDLKHVYGAFDHSGAGDTWRVVPKKKA